MSAELMKSQFVRRPSVVGRPSVSFLSLNLMHAFLSNFGCCLPWVIRWDVFLIFEKKKILTNISFFFFFFFVKLEPYGSEGAKTSKRKTFSEFSS